MALNDSGDAARPRHAADPAEQVGPGLAAPEAVAPGPDKPEGPVSAAIVAAGVGAAALGLFTTLAEASTSVKEWLQWNDAVGPLSGKTLMAVIVWLVAWAILHVAMRRKHVETRPALIAALVLITLGVIGTFPTFFQLFTPAE